MMTRRIVTLASIAAMLWAGAAPTHADNPFDPRPNDGQPQAQEDRGTARERLAAFEERITQGVTPANNAAEHLLVYLTHPDFRDHRYREKLEATGIETPAEHIPFWIGWYDYLWQKIGDNQESRDQYRLAERGRFDPVSAPDVVQWLEAVGPALDDMRAAVKLPHFSFPILNPDWPEVTFLLVWHDWGMVANDFADIVPAYLVRCHYYLSINNHEAALADLIAANQLTKLLPNFLDLGLLEDCYELGYSLNRSLELLLASGAYTDNQLDTLRQQWEQPYFGYRPAQVLDQWERLWLIDYYERVASGAEDEPSFFLVRILSMGGPVEDEEAEGWDWMIRHEMFNTRRAIARVEAQYDELVQAADVADITTLKTGASEQREAYFERLNSLEFRMPVLEKFYEERHIPDDMTRMQYTDIIVDVMLMMMMHPNRVMDASIEEYGATAHQRMGLIAIALERYHLENGAYPASLDPLVPAFLPAVPRDPFTDGDAVRYQIAEDGEGYTLHCVGIDQLDENGEGDDPDFVMTPSTRD